MKRGLVILLLLIGVICLFYQNKAIGVNAVYLKTVGIVLVMFSVYKGASKVTSKTDDKSGNFKF